jgi:Cu2+-exporting ATPase
MKHGADIAREACDVMLLGERLERIVEARMISRKALSAIRRNYTYIMSINSSLIALGVAGALTSSMSGLLHNAATVAVALNSLRPYRPEGRAGSFALSIAASHRLREVRLK